MAGENNQTLYMLYYLYSPAVIFNCQTCLQPWYCNLVNMYWYPCCINVPHDNKIAMANYECMYHGCSEYVMLDVPLYNYGRKEKYGMIISNLLIAWANNRCIRKYKKRHVKIVMGKTFWNKQLSDIHCYVCQSTPHMVIIGLIV
mgnify:CR=1 FL=1